METNNKIKNYGTRKNHVHFWSLYLSLATALITFVIGMYISMRLQTGTERLANIEIREKLSAHYLEFDSICMNAYQDIIDLNPEYFQNKRNIKTNLTVSLNNKQKYFRAVDIILPTISKFKMYGIPKGDENKHNLQTMVVMMMLGKYILEDSCYADNFYQILESHRALIGLNTGNIEICASAEDLKKSIGDSIKHNPNTETTILAYFIVMPMIFTHQILLSELNEITPMGDVIDKFSIGDQINKWHELLGAKSNIMLVKSNPLHKLGKNINLFFKHLDTFSIVIIVLMFIIGLITYRLYGKYGDMSITENEYRQKVNEINKLQSQLTASENEVAKLKNLVQIQEEDIKKNADLTTQIERIVNKTHRLHAYLDDIDSRLEKAKSDPVQLLHIKDISKDMRTIISYLDVTIWK